MATQIVDPMKAGEKAYRQALSEARKKNPRLDIVLELLNTAIEKNNPDAMYALASWYLHGKHVRKNYAKACALLLPASARVADASSALAICFEKGQGVKKNLSKAFYYHVNAAMLGDPEAYYEVGRCYYYGIGARKDADLAEVWLRQAERLGVK